jgi:heat induced stress protein YflT
MADLNVPRLDQAGMAWNTVASYTSYEEAQQAVDRLSDERFPVENIDIVGSGLRTVERVTGRLTRARAAAAGAASGAWFGLFIGLLVGLFTTGPTWIGLILGGLLIGAAWGAIFGFAGHAATRGRRDFASSQTLRATRYDIIARGGTAAQARSILQQAGLLADQPADQHPPA